MTNDANSRPICIYIKDLWILRTSQLNFGIETQYFWGNLNTSIPFLIILSLTQAIILLS